MNRKANRASPEPTPRLSGTDILQILVVVVLLGGLGWVLAKQYDLAREVSSIKSLHSGTAQRVERIADALPEMGRYIAGEMTRADVRGAVLTYLPRLKADGTWAQPVRIIDAGANQAWNLEVPVESSAAKRGKLLIIGAVRDADASAVTFSQMREWEAQAGTPVDLPEGLQASSSFVLRKADMNGLREAFGEFSTELSNFPIEMETENWRGYAAKAISSEDQPESPDVPQD